MTTSDPAASDRLQRRSPVAQNERAVDSVHAVPEWRATEQSPTPCAPLAGSAHGLLVHAADGSVSGLSLAIGLCTIGRSPRCDVQLIDARVSRRHCQLRIDGHSIWLNDLDSTNGTFVNRRRVERCALAPNDSIDVGDSSLRLVLKDSPEWAAHQGRVADGSGKTGACE